MVAGAMTLVRQLNSDGTRIYVGFALPFRDARMPGPARFIDQLLCRPIQVDEVMRRNLRHRVAKARKGGGAGFHACIVDDDHVWCAEATFTVVW